jgi:hypothetical protein
MKLKAIGCLVVLIAIPTALFLVSHFLVPSGCFDSTVCDARMRVTWTALRQYAADNDGKYPGGLEQLQPQYLNLRKVRCPARRGRGDASETGYHYIAGLGLEDADRTPVLFCQAYHLHGGGPRTYCVQFGILLNGSSIVHVRDRDLCKYDGPMRRYPFFRKYPYDGSTPTLDLVRSLEPRFPEKLEPLMWIDAAGDEEDEEGGDGAEE